MKLTPVPIAESTVRVNLALRESVHNMLKAYAAFYKAQTGREIGVAALMEQMVKDFAKEDKTFQKFLADQKKP